MFKGCGIFLFQQFGKILSYGFLCLIFVYQSCISPFLPKSCRHEPSCSHYAKQAFRRYPWFKALILVLTRLFSCHPFGSRPYIDPLP